MMENPFPPHTHLIEDDFPTNIGTTRATPTATPLVVIYRDGVEIWVALVALRVFFPSLL